jgi:hypothetical protein
MRFQTIGLTGLITGSGRVSIRYTVRARESAGPRRSRARVSPDGLHRIRPKADF